MALHQSVPRKMAVLRLILQSQAAAMQWTIRNQHGLHAERNRRTSVKAIRTHEYGGPLQIHEVADPVAGPGVVVVRNLATSLNPIDPGRASGIMRRIFPLEFPWTPGGDVSGVVESVGEGVTDFETGDPVFGYSMIGGAYAELIAIESTAIAIRPAELSVEQAAAVAVVGQTATQALQLAEISAGKTILIHGGAGGIGTLAIQLAHKIGASVITTAQAEQKEALLRLGADRVIDYTQARFEEALPPVDIVLDLVGGDTLARSYALVKRGGIVVTANQPPDPQQCEAHGIRGLMVQTKVTTEGLNDFAARVKAGGIVPIVGHVETLWSPEMLWVRRSSGTSVGKIVFAVSAL
jgi:NADPH:quinone reductase-like Zn-dependent oxidoreductase